MLKKFKNDNCFSKHSYQNTESVIRNLNKLISLLKLNFLTFFRQSSFYIKGSQKGVYTNLFLEFQLPYMIDVRRLHHFGHITHMLYSDLKAFPDKVS